MCDLRLEVEQQKLECEGITGMVGRYPYREPVLCGRDAEHECAYCGLGVCIRCTLPCFECGEQLHEHCRDDHAKETKHSIDVPVYVCSLLDPFIEVILATGERCS